MAAPIAPILNAPGNLTNYGLQLTMHVNHHKAKREVSKKMKPSIQNLGKRKWRGTWVSKSDVIEIIRCPFRVFIAHNQNIPMDQLKRTEVITALLEKGTRHEESIISKMPFQEAESLEDALYGEAILRAPVLIQNNDLGIRGIVDLINTENGKLYPIEIKNHRDLKDSDRLELAFYWRLLDPLRKGKPKPKGFVLLNTGETVEVTITREDFATLEYLIDEVRFIKEEGTDPAITKECKLCVLTEQCENAVISSGGLTLISGISSIRQSQLKSIGISDIAKLAECDTETLRHTWYTKYTNIPGTDQVRVMQTHAKAWITRTPIRFYDEPFPVGKRFAVLDLEYEPSIYVFLIGMIIVNGKSKEYHQFLAENPKEEKQIFKQFLQVLSDNPNITLVTWAGTTADMPQIREVWNVHGLSHEKLNSIEARHVDLAAYTKRNLRLPAKSFSLRDIERYFGYERSSDDVGGFQIPMLYNDYVKSRSPRKKAELRDILLTHNKEDIESTLHVLNELRTLLT